MSANLNEVMLHVDETLDEMALARLEDDVRRDSGVVSVGHRADRAHMIMVVYDSEVTRASGLVHTLAARGVHAQVVGL